MDLLALYFLVQATNRVAGTLIVESFNYKFNQQYALSRPVIKQVNNSTIDFKANVEYFEELVKMMV